MKKYCCLYCEAETFQAIHNNKNKKKIIIMIVVYTAKQKLFKQFTTDLLSFLATSALLFILRSRNFSSNSQHISQTTIIATNCCLYCEAETFQAIHNAIKSSYSSCAIVVYTAKQKLFKQFTTVRLLVEYLLNCCLYCEAETFQAIHNSMEPWSC